MTHCSFLFFFAHLKGLDPAGPGFDNIGLNRTCAKFVQVLHTDGDDFGIGASIGDADFYANNNSFSQPGVLFKPLGHIKAIYFYFASLFPENKFIGIECDTFESISRFGGFNDGEVGVFCFNTTACFPYALPFVEID